MAEGFRFMPLGLVRLRTFRLSAWVTQVQYLRRCSRTCHSEMSQQPRWETGLASANDFTHRKCAEDLGNFEESEQSRELDTEREGLTFACQRWPWAAVARDGVGQMKKPEQKECVSLSLCRRTFKLKGNKKFRDSYVIYIYIYMYIAHRCAMSISHMAFIMTMVQSLSIFHSICCQEKYCLSKNILVKSNQATRFHYFQFNFML